MIVTGLRKIESWVVAIAIVANISGALVLLVLVAIMNIDIFSRNIKLPVNTDPGDINQRQAEKYLK